MKLKDILNEVKLIPPNRILLKRDYDDYYFEVNNEKHGVFIEELKGGEVAFWHNLNSLKFFLDSKNIKYEINDNVIYIDAKYFITPDKVNEVKLIKAYPKVINLEDMWVYKYIGGGSDNIEEQV